MNFKQQYLKSKAAADKSFKELDVVEGNMTITQLYRMDLNETTVRKPTPAQTRDYIFSNTQE